MLENPPKIFREHEIARALDSQSPQKVRLCNRQSMGDIVMLTAVVRDLHRAYPGRFITGVDSSCSALWRHNPYLSQFLPDEPNVHSIECRYPLVNYSNRWPYHFLHGFTHFLNRELKLAIRPTEIRGDVHLSIAERNEPSMLAKMTGVDLPYWIVIAGGKWDITIKWWDVGRFQAVVDNFLGKIVFVQVGQTHHHHPPLKNVVDLRGKTNLRELITLVYHSQGVLCPVTGVMHLAAAVPTKPGSARLRPCVVVAGGREPPHWEAYPNHQFIHTVGMLPCCETGGCWKTRTVQLGDGEERDHKDFLCSSVVDNKLPRCMDMISAAEVIRRIEGYFIGGTTRFLSAEEVAAVEKTGIWNPS
jgi:ADP-heptose:LPS heptosyltransferase